MSVLILQGPGSPCHRLSDSTAAELWRIARSAGQALNFQTCETLSGFVKSIRRAALSNDAFVLLDPGDLATSGNDLAGVRDALEALPVPYLEVHDGSDTVLDLHLRPAAMPLATIVMNGDLASGFRIALGIALRRIGAGSGGRA